MGTLLNQPARELLGVRKDSVEALLKNAITLSQDLGVELDQVLMAYKIKELERQNDLSVHNGNVFDEQMSGLGEILQTISDKLVRK